MYHNSQLQWRGPEQKQAICAIVAGVMEVLVVMATGMGKSLLFELPSYLPGAGTTVLIAPLLVLRLDLTRRCHEMGIDCQDWSTNHDSQAALVFLSVDAAASEEGRTYLYRLHHGRQLTRIVVDECHLILTTVSYRRSMGQLGLLRSIPVQFVYLTATLPPSMRDTLLKRHYLTQVHEIRASTRRSNLKYAVQHLPPDQHGIVEAAAALMRKLWQKSFGTQHGHHRALLFTRTKADADRLAGILGYMSYHSEAGTVEDKARIIEAWVSGKSDPFLVGASGLGKVQYCTCA